MGFDDNKKHWYRYIPIVHLILKIIVDIVNIIKNKK